jgi:hypothetical protein
MVTSSDGGQAQRASSEQRRTTGLRRQLHGGRGGLEAPGIGLTRAEEERGTSEGGGRSGR